MTPDEFYALLKSHKYVSSVSGNERGLMPHHCDALFEHLWQRIEGAIREAVAEEKEKCAKEADYYAANSPTAKSIAQAIRNRD